MVMTSLDTLYQHFLEHPIVTTDSRQCPPGSIFIALKGSSFNGNSFAAKALELGCSYAVVDEPDAATDPRMLLVENGLSTLQQLAARHRSRLSIPVIGITGTNGKTTTKELMAAVIGKKYKVLYTDGNLNNHIGVPLTLLRIRPEHEIAIIEMGANHPGEIRELVEIADPDFGIITNVGKAHLEGFGSFEGVIRTKGELYDHLRAKNGKVFINMENPYLRSIAKGIDLIKYATKEGYPLWGETLSSSPFLKLRWHNDFNHESYEVQTNLIGSYNLENALAAICVGQKFEVPAGKIIEALENYTPSNNRSQWMKTDRNDLVIDAYNANPTSMAAALKNFELYQAQRKAVILGSMKELGELSQEEHKQLTNKLSTSGFDRVFLIGSEFRQTGTDYPIYDNTGDFVEYLKVHPLSGYAVLVKGSRGNKLETLLPYL
jgi:UDP-N-acetylmuramoyl-tripeptide--D-alanyl-D-alanine ligase